MGYSVFLSFTTDDKPLVEKFLNEAKNGRPIIAFRDYSIKQPFDVAWKTNCERIISMCSAMICLIGKDTHKSDNVNWEIRTATKLRKKIMAVYLTSSASPIPAALKELGIRPLPRNTDSIMKELERAVR